MTHLSATITMTRRRANRLHLTLAWAVSIVVHTLLAVALFEAYMELAATPSSPLALLARDPTLRPLVPEQVVIQPIDTAAPRSSTAESLRRAEAVPSALGRREAKFDPQLSTARPIAAPRHLARGATLPAEEVELPDIAASRAARVPEPPELTPASLPLSRTPGPVTPIDLPLVRVASRTDDLRGVVRPPADWPASQRGSHTPRRRAPASAFAHRHRQLTPEANAAAVERGLEFLARVQLDDGRWRFDDLRGLVAADAEPVQLRADAAATGLAVLAFLGAGYDHFDSRFAWVVDDALRYLVRVQQPDGQLFPEDGQPAGQVARFYSHGIATLALCETYGMTGDEALYHPAQRAIDFLAATQHPERGGWRYVPGVNADLSVTGWQVMALRSGRLAGLRVPPETLARAAECVALCRDAQRESLFCYNPWATEGDPLTRHGQRPSTVMTAVGLATQLHLGGDAADPRTQFAAEHLRANLPDSSVPAATGTLGNPARDTYYWYYATQAMYYVGGESWREWSTALKPLLVSTQVRSGRLAGSWDPLRPVPDKWADYGGRIYVTALNLLSLEIHNRHLPRETPRVAERPQ